MTLPAGPRGCDYCGLPLGTPRPAREPGHNRPAREPGETSPAAADDGPLYCCLGCRFAASITDSRGEDGEARWMMTRLGLALFFTMNVMVFTMLLWSQQGGGEGAERSRVFFDLARHACLLFTAPVLLLLGGTLVEDAWSDLRRGRPGISLLLLLGVGAAFAQSAWATWQGEGHVYFEVACMVLVAVTLGRWLEASGKLRTTEALRSLRALLPDTVRRVAPSGMEAEVALADVTVGDVLRILPGEHVPTDAAIVAGRAHVDERTVTGESEPVVKTQGDTLSSGSLDLDGELWIAVTAAPGAGTLERLIDAVSAAASRGSRQQRLAERVSAWFLPLILVVALGALVWHWRTSGPAAGILAGLAVVVVSCPCALGLATPLALWAAIGRAARRHVLVRDGDAFERLGRARTFCFDKTGTLTFDARVAAIERTPAAATAGIADDGALLALAAGLARGSTHVHSRALVEEAAHRGLVPNAILDVRSVAGCGVAGMQTAVGRARTIRLGSPAWIGDDDPAAAARPDDPTVSIDVDGVVVGRVWFRETIRPEAAAALASLRARGAALVVLSGDRPSRVARVADSLGLAWQAPLLPEGKLASIEAIRAGGGGVAMVGDGINDAPALTAADVGVALGCGADVSRWSAGICLLRDDLSDLPWLVDLAARTGRTIRWNLLWAFGYNAALVPLAAAGRVHPALAAAAMLASSVLVVTTSLRLADGGDAGRQDGAPAREAAR